MFLDWVKHCLHDDFHFFLNLCYTADMVPLIQMRKTAPDRLQFICNDPAGNAGKPVFRMVTQMLVWGQCAHQSWHLIQCVWHISEFSHMWKSQQLTLGGQVWCQMSNRLSLGAGLGYGYRNKPQCVTGFLGWLHTANVRRILTSIKSAVINSHT